MKKPRQIFICARLFMPEAIRLHPPCTQEGLTEGPRISRGFELNGVPGQVRTANLPLRRVNLQATRLEAAQQLRGFSSGCVRKNGAV